MEIHFTSEWGGCFYVLVSHDSGSPPKGKGMNLGRLHLKFRQPCAIFPNGATGIHFIPDTKKMPVNQGA